MSKQYLLRSAVFAAMICGGFLNTTTGSTAQSANPATSRDPFIAQRPAGVPADYALTPFGWMPRSCLTLLQPGQSRATAQPTQDPKASKCKTERFDNTGAPLRRPATRGQLASKESYKALAGVDVPAAYDKIDITTKIIVPTRPVVESYGVIFLNTGVHDETPDGGTLAHTAIAWDPGLKSWTASIWMDTPDIDQTQFTDPVPIPVGDLMLQQVNVTQSAGDSIFDASITNATKDQKIVTATYTLKKFTPTELMVVGMDVYATSKCNYLPSGNAINIPYMSASIAAGGKPMKDVTDMITASPDFTPNKCNILLTMDDASPKTPAR